MVECNHTCGLVKVKDSATPIKNLNVLRKLINSSLWMSDIATGAQFPLIKITRNKQIKLCSIHPYSRVDRKVKVLKHRQLPLKLIITDYDYCTEM